MRDTHALQTARLAEVDPYLRRFGYPKWNRTVRVTDVHNLFSRLPEFHNWTNRQHEDQAVHFSQDAIVNKLEWRRHVALALDTYGEGNGVLISGVVRDHFPDVVKDHLRTLAHNSSEYSARSFAHWRAAGKTLSTWTRMIDELSKDRLRPDWLTNR